MGSSPLILPLISTGPSSTDVASSHLMVPFAANSGMPISCPFRFHFPFIKPGSISDATLCEFFFFPMKGECDGNVNIKQKINKSQ